MLAAATVASAGLLAVVPASPASADPPCQPWGAYVVWLRGSGQKIGDVEASQFKNHMFYALDAAGITTHDWAEIGNLDGSVPDNGTAYPDGANEYQAVPVNDWHALPWVYGPSVQSGTDELVTHLNERASRSPAQGCQYEAIIVGGYSQGADAAGWALERNGGGGYVALTAEARRRIAFVGLYGDPKANFWTCSFEVWARGNAPCHYQGILNGRSPYVPDDFQFRVGSWCDQYDGVCDSYQDPLNGSHTTAYRNYWIWQSGAEIAAAAKYRLQTLAGMEPSLLVVRDGATVLAKAGLPDPWVAQNVTAATDLKVSGSRIGYTDTGAQLRVKDGLYGNWQNIYGPASEYAMSNSVLVVRDGNVLHAKFGALTSGWVYGIQATPATEVRVAGNRITYYDTNNQLWARDGLAGAWVNVYGAVTRYVVSNSLIVIQLGQNIFGKAGLNDAWVQLNPSPVGNDLRVSGNRISWTDTSGNRYAKDGLGGPWVNLGPADDYTASESLFVLRGGTGIHGKAGALTNPWVYSFSATPVLYVWAVRDRISYIQTVNNSLWAKDGLGGPWVNVYGPVSQYWIS